MPNGNETDWELIELQGELQTDAAQLDGAEVGELYFDDKVGW